MKRFSKTKVSKDPGPEGLALISPRRGDLGDYLYRQCSGVRFRVSATEVDPLGRRQDQVFLV